MHLEHMALYVKELEAARDFFVHYFQGRTSLLYCNEKTHFKSYFISFDSGARLEIMTSMNKQVPASENCMGYAHVAFAVGSKQKVDELTCRLGQDGYCVLSGPRLTGDGYYESCILGPENNLIEITE